MRWTSSVLNDMISDDIKVSVSPVDPTRTQAQQGGGFRPNLKEKQRGEVRDWKHRGGGGYSPRLHSTGVIYLSTVTRGEVDVEL